MKMIREGIEKWIQHLQITTREKHLAILIILATIALTVVMLVVDNQPLSDSLLRNTYGEGDRQETLQVMVIAESEDEEVLDERIEIEVNISEQMYTEEEIQLVFQECIESLDILVLGRNESIDEVYYDLNFVSEITDTGVQVEWNWSPYEVFDIYGEIQDDNIEPEGTLVELTATLCYEDYEAQYIRYLNVYPAPLSDMEAIVNQIEEVIMISDEGSVTEGMFYLPDEIEGYSLIWYGETSYRGLGILLLGFAIIILLIWEKKQEVSIEKQVRIKQMIKDYPQIINTFSLYIGAGMTVKNAWKRIVQEGDLTRYAYREMGQTYEEMMNGISEVECYERFGKRCSIRCYQRLGLLLSQNVRKGTKGLIAILEREAFEACEDRKNRAKQEGEKAGTKLLMPMFLMLAVVLIIVIVPAFYSIQIT